MSSHSVRNSSFRNELNTNVSSHFYLKKENIAIRGVIQFSFLEGKTAKEIHEKIIPTLGDSYSSYEVIRLSVNEFNRRSTSAENAQRSGIPKIVIPEIIDKVDM